MRLGYGDKLPSRVVVGFKHGEADPLGRSLERNAVFLGIKLRNVRTRKVYTVDAEVDDKELAKLKRELFVDKVTEEVTEDSRGRFDWFVEVKFKLGVTDAVGGSAREAVQKVLGRELKGDEGVFTSTEYLLSGITREQAEMIANGLLANKVVQDVVIMSSEDVRRPGGVPAESRRVRGEANSTVIGISLNVSNEELMEISKTRVLSLSLEEMKRVQEYFQKQDVQMEREWVGMDRQFWDKPTDVELEAIAQTWSEHCKHKIFNAVINYIDENGRIERVDGLFKAYIKNPVKGFMRKYGWIKSALVDNAGIVQFNRHLLLADKIETHNAPSVLDPFGGANTGIGGVIRDIIAAGIGAKPIFNIYGLCFGNPFYKGELPPGVLHPRRMRNEVHRGISSYSNESGIPLMSGWEFFDPRFMYRLLVYCGTAGTMPVKINGKPTHEKFAKDGDLIVMVGGKVGKDGIHGATFSSTELNKDSPVQAVQIGDSKTEKEVTDFLMEMRDEGAYDAINDYGAGGISSSVGEAAKDSNGCNIDLGKAPLKYQGLAPWEILVSESQERMSVAVPPEKIERFLTRSKQMDVTSTVIGTFEDTGRFHVTHGKDVVAHLDMKFLHEGLPRMELTARWTPSKIEEPVFEQPASLGDTINSMLARLNIASKEEKLRQYDHEVKGLSVVKPLVGENQDVPTDATVMRLEHGSMEGLIVAYGVNPHYSDIDTYHMTASVIDEGVRKIIAAGGRLPSRQQVFYGLDNFCWNLSRQDTKEVREFKLAQLKRSTEALREYGRAFGVPCISGKDSMFNSWIGPEGVISIPPTLLFSTRAKINDISKVVTMDAKNAGDLVYVVGDTYAELGGSEYYSHMGEQLRNGRFIGNSVPKVDAKKAVKTYNAISKATDKRIVSSIHTPTIGGLGIAAAESAMAGGLGMTIDLRKVPYSGEMRNDFILFSQSNSRFIVTVPREREAQFEGMMKNIPHAKVGEVTSDPTLAVTGLDGSEIIHLDLEHSREVWKETLRV